MNIFSPYFIVLLVSFSFLGCSEDDATTPPPTINSSPIITSSSTISVYENQTSALTITATDADNDTLTYSLSGTDSGSFTIDSSSGRVTFLIVPNFEVKNQYLITASVSDGTDTTTQNITINIINVIVETAAIEVPTLVVIMNWTDYSENDPSIWYDKIFNSSANSVNQWFNETTANDLQLVPITESSGTANDGIIMVNMGVTHPGSDNGIEATWQATYITDAITKASLSIDSTYFASLDTSGNGRLDRRELNIIFIVAGGEESYNDNPASAIWAHAWSYSAGPIIHTKTVMQYDSNSTLAGWYGRFGANHGTHTATIGIIAHEVGHSLLALGDYYDTGVGSGLGYYDVMSNGSWAYQSGDTYAGATPTQYSAYNRTDSFVDVNVINVAYVSATTDITINCSSKDVIKLNTPIASEYFLVECRDIAKTNSDIAFNSTDSTFDNKLFMMTYHVDTAKANNLESGTQNSTNHYKVALVEKETGTLMTSTAGIMAQYADVYTLGDVINTTRTYLYDGVTATNYSIEVLAEDYTNRQMTIRVTK